MPDITIHDVSQEDLEALDSRAARHGRPTEAEVLHLIHEAAGEERLVSQLERATKKVDQALSANRATGAKAPARRRYRSVEPTRNR
jgi:plasmid stability protein